MKTKTMLVGLFIGLIALASMAAETPSAEVGWFRRVFGTLTYQEVIALSQTPRDICRYVDRRVSYRRDMNTADIAAGGKEVFDRGYGDCDEIANCVIALCRAKGFEVDIAMVWPEKGTIGHAIAIGNWQGQLWMSSNGKYETVSSIPNAIKTVAHRIGLRSKDIQYLGPQQADTVRTPAKVFSNIVASPPVLKRPPVMTADIAQKVFSNVVASPPVAKPPPVMTVDIAQRDRYGWTALHTAVDANDASAVAKLLRMGADVQAKENRGWTPLHYAADGGRTNLINLLLIAGADVNTTNAMGWTSLHLAAMRGHGAVANELLESNALTDICTSRGLTAYKLAVENKRDDVALLLAERMQIDPSTAMASTK